MKFQKFVSSLGKIWPLEDSATVALIIQQFFGGDIKYCRLEDERKNYYVNILDGKSVDLLGKLTSGTKLFSIQRNELLMYPETEYRFNKLRNILNTRINKETK